MKFYPLLFEPNLHTVVWGGNQLRPYKGLEPKGVAILECITPEIFSKGRQLANKCLKMYLELYSNPNNSENFNIEFDVEDLCHNKYILKIHLNYHSQLIFLLPLKE